MRKLLSLKSLGRGRISKNFQHEQIDSKSENSEKCRHLVQNEKEQGERL